MLRPSLGIYGLLLGLEGTYHLRHFNYLELQDPGRSHVALAHLPKQHMLALLCNQENHPESSVFQAA